MKFKYSLILFILLLILFPMQSVYAQLQVSPLKLEFEIEAGETQTHSMPIKVYNMGDKTLKIIGYVMDYSVDKEGNVSYLSAGEGAFSAADWVQFDKKELVLDPGDKEETEITVTVPADAEPRDYRCIIFFESKSFEEGETEKGMQAQFSVRIGTITLLTATREGVEITRQGEISGMNTKVHFKSFIEGYSLKEPFNFSHFHFNFSNLFRPEIEVAATFKNTGNTYLNAGGFTVFQNAWIGGKLEKELPVIAVFSQTERNLKSQWENAPFLGPSKALMKIDYQSSGGEVKSLQKEVSFWIIPWQLIILLIITLIIIISVWKIFRIGLRKIFSRDKKGRRKK